MSKQFKDPYRSFFKLKFLSETLHRTRCNAQTLVNQTRNRMNDFALFHLFTRGVYFRERGSIRIFAENEIRNECKSYIYCYLQLNVSTPQSPWILSTVEKTKQNKTKGRVMLKISLKWQHLVTYWPLFEREDCKKALWLGRRILIHLHLIIGTVPLYLSPSC